MSVQPLSQSSAQLPSPSSGSSPARKRPKVIYLDAFGTLFGVKGSVGELYSNLARRAEVSTNSQAVNRAFYQSFAAADRMAFPGAEPSAIPELEYRWWKSVVSETFERVGALDRFEDFDRFFDELYGYFETAAPWYVYPDTLPSLARWRAMGIELGVISNFDSRLHRVLDMLGLAPYFQSVTLSTEVGAAKPSAKIFQAALAKHGCAASEAWHVGDSEAEDYAGAQSVGLSAILVARV